jgi:microcystin-dependent protein
MGSAYLGQIRLQECGWLGGAPEGWARCDGAELRIEENTALFALMGNVFGGDGVRTMRLPDLMSPAGVEALRGTNSNFLAVDVDGIAREARIAGIADHILAAPAPTKRTPRPCICIDGDFPMRAVDENESEADEAPSDEDYLGQIRLQDCTKGPPLGWARCDGVTVKIRENTALFAVIGAGFGGDGAFTFGLPDLITPKAAPGAGPRDYGEADQALRVFGHHPPQRREQPTDFSCVGASGTMRRKPIAKVADHILPLRADAPPGAVVEPCICIAGVFPQRA